MYKGKLPDKTNNIYWLLEPFVAVVVWSIPQLCTVNDRLVRGVIIIRRRWTGYLHAYSLIVAR